MLCTTKGKLISVFAFLLVLSSSSGFARQETSNAWQDGTPLFTRIFDSTAVRIDSVAQLVFKRGRASEPDGFRLHLDGIDATFNNSARPLDFNTLPERSDLYMITDAFARRVFVIRANDGTEIIEFRGAPNTNEAMERPVAARAFLEGNVRKILVTDQGTDRILKLDYDTKSLDWFFPPSGATALQKLAEPSAAVPIEGLNEVLICDTGNNRIVRVSAVDNSVVWSWGQGFLNAPSDVEWDGENILITDRLNHRVLLVRPFGSDSAGVVFQFGTTGVPGSDSLSLDTPEDAQLLDDGTILIADTGNERALQVNLNGEIVWEFLGALPNLFAVHRLPSGKTLAITNNQTVRLGYSTRTLESGIVVLEQPVDFDTLEWAIDLPPGTGAQFQLRTANSTGDLPGAPWLGPDSLTSFYSRSGQKINQQNDGNLIFQYRVVLSTNNPLYSPVLRGVTLTYRFFDPDIDGSLTSDVISDSAGFTIFAWDELSFNTRIPVDPSQRDDIQLEVRILDATTGEILESFQANNTSEVNLKTLSDIAKLKTVQAIRLQAILQTNNAAISPILDSWRITWRRTQSSQSSVIFTDAAGAPITALRTVAAAEAQPGTTSKLFVQLRDDNLLPLLDLVDVQLTAAKSGDTETVALERQPAGVYTLKVGLPVVVQEVPEFVFADNNVIEANDRDTLIVRYADPTAPADVAADTMLVLQFTSGTLIVENPVGEIPAGAEITFNDTLFLRLVGEFDRDFSPAQDTIFAALFDNVTTDLETVRLTELPDQPGGTVFSTGEFLSDAGMPLRNSAVGIRNDLLLQTRPNHEIGARYIDNDTTVAILRMAPDTSGTGPTLVTGEGAFDFFFAPNPFRARDGLPFRLRMEAYSGNVQLQKIEIYNLAGERIRTVDPAQINMDRGLSIQRGFRSTSRNPWWDLRTEENSRVSSGTYWAKFYVHFDDATGGAGQRVLIRKFILIQ